MSGDNMSLEIRVALARLELCFPAKLAFYFVLDILLRFVFLKKSQNNAQQALSLSREQ
jgi:hypothetical protein